MTTISAPSLQRRKIFQPDLKSLCLCGSGIRFQDCCKGRLPGFKSDKKWREAAREKRWTSMVRHLRADVTQYTIWHLSHTAPAIERKPELREGRMMGIDIEALSGLVANLMWGYARKGRLSHFPDVLRRLGANISDPRWNAKIAYHLSICALWCDQREQAKLELAPMQPITANSRDIDLLQLQVDLHGSDMGMIGRIAFFDRIRELTKSNSDKLQYAGARAFEILLGGDEKGAGIAFEEAVTFGRACEEEMPLSSQAEIWFCKVLEGRAMLDPDANLFAEIDQRLAKLANLPNEWSLVGLAHLLRSLGDCRRYGGAFQMAIDTYRASYRLVPAQELRTFEAECELRLGNPDEAYRLAHSVAVDKLDPPERADHAFTSFAIALARGDKRSLLDARDLLKLASTPQAYFETRRLENIVAIDEALEALDNAKPLPTAGPFLAGLQRLSRYIMLQPNWNGIGLNGNVMVEDFIAHTRERSKRDGEGIPTYPDDRDSDAGS